MKDLKAIYQATTLEIAEQNLCHFEKKWGDVYPISVRSWRKNWNDLSTYFAYNHDLRKIIYTTNTIEGFNRQVRKATKTRQMFKTKTSLEKVLYLAIGNITRKWDKPVYNWAKILGQLEAFFPGKIEKYLR